MKPGYLSWTLRKVFSGGVFAGAGGAHSASVLQLLPMQLSWPFPKQLAQIAWIIVFVEIVKAATGPIKVPFSHVFLLYTGISRFLNSLVFFNLTRVSCVTRWLKLVETAMSAFISAESQSLCTLPLLQHPVFVLASSHYTVALTSWAHEVLLLSWFPALVRFSTLYLVSREIHDETITQWQ